VATTMPVMSASGDWLPEMTRGPTFPLLP